MSLPLPQRCVSARRAFVARTPSLSFAKSKGVCFEGVGLIKLTATVGPRLLKSRVSLRCPAAIFDRGPGLST